MSAFDVDGLNAGYARALLDEYLENPDAVPSEWRRLFESGDSELVATHPGLLRLLETLREDGNGAAAAPVAAEPAETKPELTADSLLVGGVAAAMALSRRTGRTATSPRGSTRSVRSPSAIRRSSRSVWSLR